MTEFELADLNKDGLIDPQEFQKLALEDRYREILDADSKRDTQRRLTVACASGMILYPFAIVGSSALGLDNAANLIADIAAVYVVAASGVVVGYFGFNAMEKKNVTSTDRANS
tara:strand:+ start:15064 stop:15402 length:339 start_codon:yes stop_codon:yes gene_type:complete